MPRITKRAVLFTVALLGGCSSSEPPSPSKFIQTVDLESIVKMAAEDGVDVSPEYVGSDTEVREKDKGAAAKAQIVMSFQCEPAKLSNFATAVSKGLRAEIVASGGKADEMAQTDHDWLSSPFTLNYSHGDATGVARIAIGKTSSTEYPYELRVTVDEAVAD